MCKFWHKTCHFLALGWNFHVVFARMKKKIGGFTMKKLFSKLKGKCSMVTLANMFALAMVVGSVNAACFWAHHQPEVPDEAMKFRRF